MTDMEKFEVLEALNRSDIERVQTLVKSKSSKKSFKEWLLSLTRIFEVHLVVKMLGVTIVDFKIPKDGEA